ncbi:MAG: PAS domain S-box protein [Alphaproteobacteria bacterium]
MKYRHWFLLALVALAWAGSSAWAYARVQHDLVLSAVVSVGLLLILIYLLWAFWLRERDHHARIQELEERKAELERLTSELTETKQNLEDAHEFARLGIFEADLVHGTHKWSNQMYRLLGYEPGEVEPSIPAFKRRLDPTDHEAAVRDLITVKEQGKPFEGYRYLALPDGERRILHAIMNARRDKDGKITKLIGTFQDVSEREEFREALQQHGQFLRDVLDSMPAFVAIFLPDGTLIETNRAFLGDIGLDRADAVGKPFWEAFWWSDSQTRQDVIRSALERAAQGERVGCEFEVRVGENKFVTLEGGFSPIRNHKGAITNIVASGVDITDRVAAENMLKETKRQLEEAERIAEIGSWESDDTIDRIIWSDNLYRIFGYEPHEITPSRSVYINHTHPEDLERIRTTIVKAVQSGTPYEVVHRITRRDGAERCIQAIGRPHVDREGTRIGTVGVVRDVTEVRNAQIALVESRDMLSGILNIAPEATIVADKDLKIVMFSAGASKAFGYKPEEIIGSNINKLIPARFQKKHAQNVSDFARGSSASTRRMGDRSEVMALRKNGEEFPAQASLSKLETAQGPIFTVVLRDVSEEKASRAALLAAQKAAEAASKAKSDFLANMSHEIRTPMNGVLGMSGLLLDTNLNPEQHEWVDVIRKSGENLLEIINDILDFSKIEAGKLVLAPVPFDLPEMIRELTNLFSFKVQEKGIELAVDLAPNLTRRVVGDPGRLRQILLNLLGNAIKFTERGHILIRAFANSEGAGKLRLFFEVEDTGIGIPPEKTALIFEKFSQAEESTTRKFGGTGLGLTISSKLVAMMNGKISVTSEAGVGSIFHFDALVGEAKDLESSFIQVAACDIKGLRAVIVDDPTLHQKILRGYLTAWDVQCDAAPNAERALQMVEEAAQAGRPYHFALGDFRGVDMSRVRAVKSGSGDSETMFIMITGFGQLVTAADLAKQGFSGLFVKPVFPDEIKAGLQILWDAQQKKSQAPFISRHYLTQVMHGDGAKTSVRPDMFAGTKVLAVEDMKVNLMLVTKILRKHGCEVFAALNGREAVEMMREHDYAIVFMDCQMPEMDGFEATRIIREEEKARGRHTAIVALTADAMTGDREKCLRAGMDDYLNKPLKADQITEMLRKWVPKDSAPRMAAESPVLDPVI